MLWEEQQKQGHIQMEESKSNNETCDICHGSGVVGDGTCSSCNGVGEI